MNKENRFVVVGGQYSYHIVGHTPTLIGAKRLANKNAELWDHRQGWHVPAIYRIEDVYLVWDSESSHARVVISEYSNPVVPCHKVSEEEI